jgi:hypothetical protein
MKRVVFTALLFFGLAPGAQLRTPDPSSPRTNTLALTPPPFGCPPDDCQLINKRAPKPKKIVKKSV